MREQFLNAPTFTSTVCCRNKPQPAGAVVTLHGRNTLLLTAAVVHLAPGLAAQLARLVLKLAAVVEGVTDSVLGDTAPGCAALKLARRIAGKLQRGKF